MLISEWRFSVRHICLRYRNNICRCRMSDIADIEIDVDAYLWYLVMFFFYPPLLFSSPHSSHLCFLYRNARPLNSFPLVYPWFLIPRASYFIKPSCFFVHAYIFTLQNLYPSTRFTLFLPNYSSFLPIFFLCFISLYPSSYNARFLFTHVYFLPILKIIHYPFWPMYPFPPASLSTHDSFSPSLLIIYIHHPFLLPHFLITSAFFSTPASFLPSLSVYPPLLLTYVHYSFSPDLPVTSTLLFSRTSFFTQSY